MMDGKQEEKIYQYRYGGVKNLLDYFITSLAMNCAI